MVVTGLLVAFVGSLSEFFNVYNVRVIITRLLILLSFFAQPPISLPICLLLGRALLRVCGRVTTARLVVLTAAGVASPNLLRDNYFGRG